MATPLSLKNSPLTDLGNFNGPLGDDYVHKCLETYKLKGVTSNGSTWNYKAKINAKDGKLNGTYSGEGKIQFPLGRQFFWLGFRQNGDLKFHLDLGTFNVANRNVNLFSNIKTNTSFGRFAIRFGANYSFPFADFTSRVEHTENALQWTQRVVGARNNLSYGFVSVCNMSGKAPCRFDSFIGYAENKYNVTLQHLLMNLNGNVQPQLGTLVVNANYTVDENTQVGVELSKAPSSKDIDVTIGGNRRVNSDLMISSKINQDLFWELSAKYKVNSQTTLVASSALPLKKKANAIDLSKIPPFPLGFQLALNL